MVANRYSPQLAKKATTATATTAGDTRGSTIRRSTVRCPQPSMSAASLISRGMPAIALRRIHTPIGITKAACSMARASRLSVMPTWL